MAGRAASACADTTPDGKSSTYGLMPRGQGDCGLDNDGDMYGVFLPHNIWSVYADRCSLEAAEILGKTADVAELKTIFQSAHRDLLSALDRGAIKESDYPLDSRRARQEVWQLLGRAQCRISLWTSAARS